MKHHFKKFESREQLDLTLAENIAHHLVEAKSPSIAFSGGSTPAGMLQQLSKQTINWSDVFVTLVDERWVPDHHPDSNAGMLHKNLIPQKPLSRFLPLWNADRTIESQCNYLQDQLFKQQPINVIVLGMGLDGHTASWFPNSPELHQATTQTGPLITQVTTASSPHPRITLTLAAAILAEQVILHITGSDKRAVFEAALQSSDEHELPIRSILKRRAIDVYWAN